VNMMPFDIANLRTLPSYCQQYWPLIEICLSYVAREGKKTTGYLSIDERPTPIGKSQRREGLHVESPGLLPVVDKIVPSSAATASSRFVPGVEHHWGNGIMMRSEYLEGGIFLGSNLANTTAVWNCRIRDEHGDIIAPHGSIERCREVLGPPSHILDAGELVWLTDKTPHEALPRLSSSSSSSSPTPRRQFFRLVLGEVTAWFADHSTDNPTGYPVPSKVRIVVGNKYDLVPLLSASSRSRWIPGTAEEIKMLRKEKVLREVFCRAGLGHADLVTETEIRSIDELIRHSQGSPNDPDSFVSLAVKKMMSRLSSAYYERRQLAHLLRIAAEFLSSLQDDGTLAEDNSDEVSNRLLDRVGLMVIEDY
jgi:hypothetical protein